MRSISKPSSVSSNSLGIAFSRSLPEPNEDDILKAAEEEAHRISADLQQIQRGLPSTTLNCADEQAMPYDFALPESTGNQMDFSSMIDIRYKNQTYHAASANRLGQSSQRTDSTRQKLIREMQAIMRESRVNEGKIGGSNRLERWGAQTKHVTSNHDGATDGNYRNAAVVSAATAKKVRPFRNTYTRQLTRVFRLS